MTAWHFLFSVESVFQTFLPENEADRLTKIQVSKSGAERKDFIKICISGD
jgi:hypothetical protein